MARTITITVPDDLPTFEIVGYVRKVAQQIDEGYLSGHVDVDHYWESEGRIS
jgi:hypothetical protein